MLTFFSQWIEILSGPGTGSGLGEGLPAQFYHRLLVILHTLEELELPAAAVEILSRTVDLEVAVPGQVIGKKAASQFQGDRLGRQGQ